MNISTSRLHPKLALKRQQGLTTLAITLLLLLIITLVVLFSTNVAFFEQRTTTNENRARLSEQAAEYALNLSGEFLKANVSDIVTVGSGWLGSGGTRRWTLCSSVSPMPATHACMAERDAARRNHLYFYNFDGSASLPYSTAVGTLDGTAADKGIGGNTGTTFKTTTIVQALLCRLDTTVLVGGVISPQCRAIPDEDSSNRIAVTLVANVMIAGENTNAIVKETWASISTSLGGSAVPLVAAGTVKGLGTATIVAGPNGGGPGAEVSVWSPCPVKFTNGTETISTTGCTAPAGGNGSVQTCQLDAFLNGTPKEQLKTTCASGNTCGCPNSGAEFLSGGGAMKVERQDIVDRDGGLGTDINGLAIPDIDFFPTSETTIPGGNSLDNNADALDDSMFEYLFSQDIMPEGATSVPSTCGPAGNENCALVALRDNLNATIVAGCGGFGPTSTGLYYVTGACTFPNNTNVGSATSSVVIVVNGDAGNVSFRNNFFGMLFIRSNNDAAQFSSNGGRFFGSIVVEGEVDLTGNVYIVYDNTSTDTPGKPLPANTRFAKVTGSWLDNNTGF